MTAVTNYRLISEEINTILSEVLGKFLVAGSPTKHGGLRFLDIQSAKTFGFERTQEHEGGNLLIISAPIELQLDKSDAAQFNREKIEQSKQKTRKRLEDALRKGPYADHLHDVIVRSSADPGKSRKLFLEVQYLIASSELINDKAILSYAKKHGMTNTSDAVRRILREHIAPMAKNCMDYLVETVRKEK